MRCLVIANGEVDQPADIASMSCVTVDGVRTHCAIIETDAPESMTDTLPAEMVLLRTRAFSLNYRDRAFFYAQRESPAGEVSVVGSEFIAEVVAVGSGVRQLVIGDRVIPNHAYGERQRRLGSPLPGIPTNGGSLEYQLLHQDKLMPVPPEMSDPVGSAFSLGAQTAYSMIRRSGVTRGARVLVTAGSSNTSLFLIAALARRGVEVYTTSTTASHAEALRALGVADVVLIKRGDSATTAAAINHLSRRFGGFDVAFDPFADVYAHAVILALTMGGAYVSCGIAGQNPGSQASFGSPSAPFGLLWMDAVKRNVTLIANCLGTTEDLSAAISDYVAGRLPVRIDAVFDDDHGADFVVRSFGDRDRFGKVVMSYAPETLRGTHVVHRASATNP